MLLIGCEGESGVVVNESNQNPIMPKKIGIVSKDKNNTANLISELKPYPTPIAIRNGLYFHWYESGEKKGETTYEDGMKEGPSQKWYLNGQLKQQCSFVGDRYHGLYKSWYENGNLRVLGNYVNGKHHGEWILYNQNGEKMPSIYYENGLEVTRKLNGIGRN